MQESADPLPPDTNPFSTRFVRPGALAYLFSNGGSFDLLLARLNEKQGWGQVVGPHGTGKSTLLHGLVSRLIDAGQNVERFSLHQGETKLNVDRQQARGWNRGTQIVVDGYEQLNWWNRWRLVRWCRKQGAGLLVSSHRDVGLPTLIETHGSLEATQALASKLLRGDQHFISRQDVAAAFQNQQANVRETLFSLYDLYEVRRRGTIDSIGKV